jgi:glutathione-independent formaldehyde dehydrogenase
MTMVMRSAMSTGNRGVVYMGPGEVKVLDIPFPKLELNSMDSPVASERQKRKCQHGVILKVRRALDLLRC